MKHTPGPWTIDDDFQPSIYGPHRTVIALTAEVDTAYAQSETLANARLIAAAPDLLVIAQEMLSRLPLELSLDGEIFRDAIKSVVAKATGGA